MTDPNCIFCKIIAGELPSDTVYQDDLLIAFRDINPVAPTHILIVPRKHIVDNNAFSEEDSAIAGAMFAAVRKIAESEWHQRLRLPPHPQHWPRRPPGSPPHPHAPHRRAEDEEPYGLGLL